MRRITLLATLALLTSACAGRSPFRTVDGDLDLDTVVLYRNGIGYFERTGKVDEDVLRIKVRKDQVNDLLKSLTVVDREGKAVSVSMPLDPQTWANAALATLAPGNGSLAQVLDALRGTRVSITTNEGTITGRITLVEVVKNEPTPHDGWGRAGIMPPVESTDFKVTLLNGKRFEVVRLSQAKKVRLEDGDLALQFHRALDASAGEGMFEQVEVEVRLVGKGKHDLRVSYVVSAPMWKPTYRVVLPEDGKGKGLLQGWAVVDNVSGEDWRNVQLSLTSGAPIAFRYDLHSPRTVDRADMTEAGVTRQAEVAMGETSYGEPAAAPPPPPAAPEPDAGAYYEEEADYAMGDDGLGGLSGGGAGGGGYGAGSGRSADKASPKPTKSKKSSAGSPGVSRETASRKPAASPVEALPAGPAIDAETLRRSTQASARSKQISGLTRIDVSDRVTVPEGSSTMVAVVNQDVEAEETFLYKPGGAGWGYENNPYRVVRFTNASKYVLEPGPISIYAGGSFVGEGLSEAVGAGASVTIPFAVEPNIMVNSSSQWGGEEMKLVRIVRGVLEVETWYQTKTTWEVRLQSPAERDVRVFVRHPRQGSNYELVGRPPGTEDLEGAYLVPVPVKKGGNTAKIELVEQTPSRTTITIWDGRALPLLDTLLQATKLDARMREQIQPIVDLRREIGRIDTEIEGLERQQIELDQRAQETRYNLEAIKKDPAASTLRKKLNDRLDEFSKDADKIGRKIVELNSKRLDLKIKLEDALIELTMEAPQDEKKPSAVAPAGSPAGTPPGLGAEGDATKPATREGG